LDKRARAAARRALAEHRDTPARVRQCGRTRIATHVEVLRAGDSQSCWYDGVIRCRTRFCPVCWIARRAQLRHEVQFVVDTRAAETNRVPLLATLTIRHSASDPVEICRAVRACWRKFVSGKRWKNYREHVQLEWIVAEEVTRGDNGWHPHLHVLLMPERKFGDPLEHSSWWYERWASIVERELGADHEPDLAHGADLRPCTSSQYLTKIGLELTDPGDVKGRLDPSSPHYDPHERRRGLSPLGLLEEGTRKLRAGESARELDLYVELQNSRYRCRDLTFSRGLRVYRDAMPAPAIPSCELKLRGSHFERLAANGDEALIDVLEQAGKGQGRAAAEWWLGPLPVDDDEEHAP